MSTLTERYTKLRERIAVHLDYQRRLRERNQVLKQENRLLKERLKQEKHLRIMVQDAFDDAKRQVITDPSTGLKNRAGLLQHYEWLTTTTLRLFRYNTSSAGVQGTDGSESSATAMHFRSAPMVLVIIDLNNFKKINDTFGHIMGDTVLNAFAEIMHSTFRRRRYDLPARVGGDEFAILLPMTSPEKAELLMQRFHILFETSTSQALKLFRKEGGGFSYGMAQVLYYTSGNPLQDAWERADQHMYRMKEETRQFARAG